ncbi:MAG: hypothetical protein KAS36_03885 [Anaerolineales bacterium]|nr:hypothetical protein [Anaerolineales bacterium]
MIDKEELLKWLDHQIEWHKKQAEFYAGMKTGDKYDGCVSALSFVKVNVKTYPVLQRHKTTDKKVIVGVR